MVNTNLYNTFFHGNQRGGSIAKGLSTLLYAKRDLLVKTFANLIFQLGITYYVMEKTDVSKDKEKKVKYNYTIILIFLYMIAFILVLGFIPMPSWLKFILFCGFSYCSGYILSNLKSFVSEEVINNALLGTISIFAIMFALGLFMLLSGIKLGIKTAIFLFFCLLFLIIARLFNNFTEKSSAISKNLTIIGIILFAVYIIYDTNTILQKNYDGDFITASLDYYLDTINIFTNLVNFNSDS
jgi:FtsH-binding integral membrane protein